MGNLKKKKKIHTLTHTHSSPYVDDFETVCFQGEMFQMTVLFFFFFSHTWLLEEKSPKQLISHSDLG